MDAGFGQPFNVRSGSLHGERLPIDCTRLEYKLKVESRLSSELHKARYLRACGAPVGRSACPALIKALQLKSVSFPCLAAWLLINQNFGCLGFRTSCCQSGGQLLDARIDAVVLQRDLVVARARELHRLPLAFEVGEAEGPHAITALAHHRMEPPVSP